MWYRSIVCDSTAQLVEDEGSIAHGITIRQRARGSNEARILESDPVDCSGGTIFGLIGVALGEDSVVKNQQEWLQGLGASKGLIPSFCPFT